MLFKLCVVSGTAQKTNTTLLHLIWVSSCFGVGCVWKLKYRIGALNLNVQLFGIGHKIYIESIHFVSTLQTMLDCLVFFTIYLIRVSLFLFWFMLVASSCDVRNNDVGICKVALSLLITSHLRNRILYPLPQTKFHKTTKMTRYQQ